MSTPTYKQALESMIRALAPLYGVDPDLAAEIVRLESSYRRAAVGDRGQAVGLWQWHYPSWVVVRREMKLPTEDRRDDAFEATITALYAIGKMGLGPDWWTTFELARRNINRNTETGSKDER